MADTREIVRGIVERILPSSLAELVLVYGTPSGTENIRDWIGELDEVRHYDGMCSWCQTISMTFGYDFGSWVCWIHTSGQTCPCATVAPCDLYATELPYRTVGQIRDVCTIIRFYTMARGRFRCVIRSMWDYDTIVADCTFDARNLERLFARTGDWLPLDVRREMLSAVKRW